MPAPSHAQQLLHDIKDTRLGKMLYQWVEQHLHRSLQDVVLFEIETNRATGQTHFTVEFYDGATFEAQHDTERE